MNFRKFYFIICSILSIFMFFMGTFVLLYINLDVVEGKPDNNGFIHEILGPLKENNKSINVLVLGGDQVNQNTDTMMLINFNPVSSKASILSIPRDTKVLINGRNAKINAAYPYGGGDLAVQTVSELLGINVEYYVFLSTSSFREIIDILDGVDYNVPVDMDWDDPLQNLHIHFKKGPQHFNGIKAEQFMRFRQNNNGKINEFYDGSDLKRIDAQQNFIKELVKQKLNVFYITKVDDIINSIFSNLKTNLSMNEILKMSSSATRIQSENIQMFKIPGESVLDGAWYYIMDKNKTKEIIDENFKTE
ncbi:MAG: LCP family protein [Clostridium sp.]|nr:LCP family protein [Clostridium sp.]